MEGSEKIDERRQFKRVSLKEPVQYRFKDSNDFGGCLSTDISEEGIRINVSNFIPVNTEVTLSVQLTHEKVVECRGRVMWVEQLPHAERYQAGLKFESTDSLFDAKQEIHKFLDSYLRNKL